MIREFIDREEELALLEREWIAKGGRLVILYGRRRVGKTRLIDEFAKGKKGILYTAEDTAPRIQILRCRDACAAFLEDPLLATLDIGTWEQLFTYLAGKQVRERAYLVMDEVTYLMRNDVSFLPALQGAWDRYFSGSPWVILLSGSLLSLMADLALSYTSPLYGRRTRDLLLPPLPFRHARRFFRFPYPDSLKVYLSIGGIPEYLQRAGEYGDAESFYRAEFFNRYGYFYHEPSFILSQEFRELKVYQSILHAIASGNSAPTTIAQFCGMDTRHMYPYLESMIRLGFIERETPVLVKTRAVVYRIRDPVFDFWYRFIFPRRQEIESDRIDHPSLVMEPYFGKRFESFVRQEYAPALFPGSRIGTWWYREDEIDLIALNEETSSIVYGECKWGDLTRDEAIGIIRRLKEKARLVRAAKYDRHIYTLITAGQIEEKDSLRKGDVLVYDRGDLEKYLSDEER